jgi:hypothetical protein
MDQMTIIFGAGGLLVLTLVVASIAHRYHAFVEERRQHVLRILKRVEEIEGLIKRMVDLPIPVELERLLRRDTHARLLAVRSVHARYEGINEMIFQAQQGIEQVVARPVSGEMSEQKVERFSRLISELEWLLKEGRLLVEVNDQEREQLLQAIDMRRMEILCTYHIREGARLLKGNQLHQAQWHSKRLESMLSSCAVESNQIKTWREEADQLHRQLAERFSSPDY